MARARLLGHVELLTIAPKDDATTRVDPDTLEPIPAVGRSSSVQLEAQVEDLRRNERVPGQGGARLPTVLQLTFLASDVATSGWTPRDGDRLIARANRDGSSSRALSLYLTRIMWDGPTHYGHELVIADAVNRDPSREQNEGL